MYPWVYIVMMILGIYCYDDPGLTLLVLIYIIISYKPWTHIVMMTLEIHCYDDPGYTLLVLIYIIIPYIPWIHIVMMTLGIHCWYLSIYLYLLYHGYTLL